MRSANSAGSILRRSGAERPVGPLGPYLSAAQQHMSHDSRYGSRPGGGPHERRNRRHHRHGGGRGPRREVQKSSGGFWGFLKKLFGMGGGSSRSTQGQDRPRNGRSDAPRTPRPRSTPPMEVLTPRLYIGNLSYDASESDIFDHLSKIAAVKNVEVVREGGGNSKGFGFAEMQTLEGAQEVAKKLHDTDFMGRLLIVNGAKSTGERSGGPRRDDRPPRGDRPERGSEFDYERGPRNPSYD